MRDQTGDWLGACHWRWSFLQLFCKRSLRKCFWSAKHVHTYVILWKINGTYSIFYFPKLSATQRSHGETWSSVKDESCLIKRLTNARIFEIQTISRGRVASRERRPTVFKLTCYWQFKSDIGLSSITHILISIRQTPSFYLDLEIVANNRE